MKTINSIIGEFEDKLEMLNGVETEEYLHLRYSDTPFGYRPLDIEDVRQAFADYKKELKKNIGQLRQYLNERTEKKLIASTELEIFLLH